MQIPGINPSLLRLLSTAGQEQLADLFTPGRILKAEVVSVFQDRAVLSFGRGIRLEAQTQTPLKEGQQVTVQVQTPQAPPQPGQPPPLVLKLVQNPASAGQTNTAPTPAEPGQTAAQQTLGREAVILRGEQSAPAAGPQPNQGLPQAQHPPGLVWLPIPLPGGGQGWAQIHVPPEAPRKGSGQGDSSVRQVRIWWETPELGAVQVTLDGAASDLSAIFTAVSPESRTQIESHLSDLRARLQEAGFPEARLGCRQARAGEAVEPFRPEGTARLDLRL